MVEVLFFLFGICIGSFLNVCIDRLPKGRSIAKGRSKCDFCRKTLTWYELIPIFSFFLQGGKCRNCHKHLTWQYPLVESTTGALFVMAYLHYSSSPLTAVFFAIILTILLGITVADFKYTIIPDYFIVVGIIAAIILVMVDNSGDITLVNRLGSSIFASLGFLILWSLTKGRGLGFGDVKLVFLLGFILGFPNIIIALYAGFLTGGVAGVILILLGKKRVKSHIAFGPFLIAGYFIALLWGKELEKYWTKYLG